MKLSTTLATTLYREENVHLTVVNKINMHLNANIANGYNEGLTTGIVECTKIDLSATPL